MRKRSGVIAALEERMRGRGPIGPLYLPWLVWISLLLFSLLIPIRTALAQEAGQIVSVLGAVEIMREGRWQLIGVGETLKVGEIVRTREDGRIAVQLANGSQLKINANSHLELKQIDRGEGLIRTKIHPLRNILRLLSGEVWVRGNAEPLEIQTIPVIATIRGTEFNLAVGPSDFARLAVLDGLVEFSNPQGSVLVTANEQATAKLGEPPRKTVLLNPLDAVQWSLYYPDPAGDRAERERAARADPRSPRHWTWAARQHLLRGQVPEARRALDRALALAPNDARAYSLRAAVALVQNRKAEARADAERAVAADPTAPEAYLALSWVQQAEFDLDGALASARRAVALDPDDPQALIQESRLLFGMGRTNEATKVAEKARQRAPKDALVNSTWGFLQLARGRVDEADQAFREAIAQDSTLGEPHLGLGLVLFRRNQTEAAVEEIRKATLLEPKVSLYNSYLGKAYYETKDDRLAQKYFEAAKQLDPRDPTPHFYDAIRLQSVNRPVEAVQELQKSIELNDDRAVYRSRLLLDEDLAARDAALGKIYNEVGFGQLGLNEGWKSLASDPANYSAHRLLADSYSALPRHEIARVSELLQSQLLQPINITPVQPQLAETNLLIPAGAGLTTPSMYEFNPLFVRDHSTLSASGVVGNNDTLGDEMILSSIVDKFSYSLGQFHYQTDGFRPNNDLKHDIYNLFTQAELTPEFNLQAEYRYRETELGDLRLNFNNSFSPNNRTEIHQESSRLGARYSPSPQLDMIASLIYAERQEENDVFLNRKNIVLGEDQGYQGEAQLLYRDHHFNLIAGFGAYAIDADRYQNGRLTSSFARNQQTLYSYVDLKLMENLIWQIGFSYDSYEQQNLDINELNPKFGLQWNITDNLHMRAAAFKTTKRALVVNQTIEPTQVAGFNQFYDDFNGTESKRYGVGLDARLSNNLFGGVEISRRELEVPVGIGTPSLEIEEDQESLSRIYLYWLHHNNWAVTAEYLYEDFQLNQGNARAKIIPNWLTTASIPLSINYFNPSGFFAEVGAIYVRQHVEFYENFRLNTNRENFTTVDIRVGYRLPKRWGIISIEVNNLFDEEFRFQDTSFMSPNVSNPRFVPNRNIFVVINFNL